MTGRDLRFGMVVSTAGSVMNEVLKDPFVRTRVPLVVVERPGPAFDKARAHGVPATIVDVDGVEAFCGRVLTLFGEHAIDYVLSFYTEFYSEEFRRAFKDRILNFHPSLLPAFKGPDGFGDTVNYPARFAGNTVELIADVMDEGKIVMQTACPVDTNVPIDQTRHRVFVQQCKALLQTARWLQDRRIIIDGNRVAVDGARFDDGPFSPAIDCEDVASWRVPDPVSGPG